MINQVIDAVCKTLHDEFGDGYTIYTRNVEQGLSEPCFFVLVIEAADTKFRGDRYRSTVPICIHYIPDGPINYDVADRLLSAMETIPIDGDKRIRGHNRRIQTHDDIIQMFVDFTVFSDLERIGEPMDAAEIQPKWRTE